MSRRPAALLVLLLLGASACTQNGGAGAADTELTRESVRKRPTLEAEQARVIGVRDAVRDALATELGLTNWSDEENASGGGCGSGVEDGEQARPSTLVLTGGVPDGQWEAVVGVVSRVAGQAGFGQLERVVDRPGQHQIVLHGERESLLRLGTILDATLYVETGCHLPAAEHPGSAPAGPGTGRA